MSDSYETGCTADAPPLWPTPSACNANDGEGAATWLARRERLRLKGYNGNGAGIPLAIAVQVAEPTPTDATRLWSSPRAYSFDRSHRPGLTPLDIQVRGLYPHNKRYRPGAMDAPDASTWSSVAHLASQLRRLVSALATGTTAGSGMRHCASLATSAHGGPYWSSPQASLAFDMPEGSRPLDEYSGSWPRSAIVSATTRGAPVLWARRTGATGSSSSGGEWKTPRAAMASLYAQSGASLAVRARDDEVRAWPSPAARDWRDGRASEQTMQRNSRPLNEVVGQRNQGQLSPDWVELLMALPIGWTNPGCAQPQEWPGWPAPPGQPQHAYESPSLARGVKDRVGRLKALGNAVVAAQALPLFQAIMDVERADEAGRG